MADYAVTLRPSARKRFLALDKQIRARIAAAIDALASDPHPTGQAIKVKNADEWRIRVGNYRVTYAVDHKSHVITVTWVGHRKDAYRDLS